MAATKFQYGGTLHRINREPLDDESVLHSYSDLIDRTSPGDKQNRTKVGKFYAGFYTAVVDDENASYNGPYYISYTKTGTAGNTVISYHHNKIVCDEEVRDMLFTCGTIL